MKSNESISLLFCVGREHYKLHLMVQEYSEFGISKRIPAGIVPPGGLERGRSKVFVAHPDAILKVNAPGRTLLELALALVDAGRLTMVQVEKMLELGMDYWYEGLGFHPYDPVPAEMLDIACALSGAENRLQLVKDFQIAFHMGIVGWSYLTRVEYVTAPGEEGLPEQYQHLEGEVTPVKVLYIDKKTGEILPDQDPEILRMKKEQDGE